MSPTERLSVRRKDIEASGYTRSSLNIFTFPLAHFLFLRTFAMFCFRNLRMRGNG